MKYLILALLLISCGTENSSKDISIDTLTPIFSPAPKKVVPAQIEEELIEEEEEEEEEIEEQIIEPIIEPTPTPIPLPQGPTVGQIKADEFDAYLIEKVAELNAKEIGDQIIWTWIYKPTTHLGLIWLGARDFFGPALDSYQIDFQTIQPYISWYDDDHWATGIYNGQIRNTLYHTRIRVSFIISESPRVTRLAKLYYNYELNEQLAGLPLLKKIHVELQLSSDPQN